MVRLLLLCDLHLSTTGPEIPPACPDLDTLDVDAIVSVGDVIDDNLDHAGDAEAGRAYEERGRAFFERLNDVGVPVFVVPGNHDPIACTRRLVAGLKNVTVTHRRVVDGESTTGAALDGVQFVGWGCEQFDLTPTFEYDQYPGVVPAPSAVDDVARTATRSASAVESAVGRFLDGEIDARTAASELGVARDRRASCAAELDALATEFETIRRLFPDGSGTTILLSHESPFNVAFDHHHAVDGLRGQLHRGSIPLKMAIATAAPEVVFCGHTHVEGRDAIETTAGYADVYNPGSPGAAFVEVDAEYGTLRVLE